MKKEKDITSLIEDTPEMIIWNNFKDYNKTNYIFLYFLGFFSGIVILSTLYLVI